MGQTFNHFCIPFVVTVYSRWWSNFLVSLGRSKIHAKNSAAENALKHLVKHNKLTELKKDENDGEKMDIIEDDVNQPLPWTHVASFAIYKLFTSWGEDPNLKVSRLVVIFLLSWIKCERRLAKANESSTSRSVNIPESNSWQRRPAQQAHWIQTRQEVTGQPGTCEPPDVDQPDASGGAVWGDWQERQPTERHLLLQVYSTKWELHRHR